jgi:hypothetical protein
MPVLQCGGCPRLISVSNIPGGNPIAKAHPDQWSASHLRCPGCRAALCDRCAPPGARACKVCGAALGSSAAAPGPAAATRRQPLHRTSEKADALMWGRHWSLLAILLQVAFPFVAMMSPHRSPVTVTFWIGVLLGILAAWKTGSAVGNAVWLRVLATSSYVQTATQEVFKAVTARYTAPDLIAQRAKVSNDISLALRDKLALYGAQVINIDMRNFSFGADYMKAINDKVTQEQLRLTAENKLKTVEAEQKQKVAIAEAEAKATIATAQASAESLRIQNEALARNKDVLDLRRIEVEKIKAERWNGKLPTNIYAGAPIPFLNLGK